MERASRLPSLPWSDLLPRIRWRQGEHVTVVGPTGAGKTEIGKSLLEDFRSYSLVIATKPRDPLIDELRKDGYFVAREWPPPLLPRIVFWPKVEKPEDIKAKQKPEIARALSSVYTMGSRGGNYAVLVDETMHVTTTLGLQPLIVLLVTQGRTLRASIVLNAPRPRHIPLVCYDASTHLFFFRETDASNLQRIGEISGAVDGKTIAAAVRSLRACVADDDTHSSECSEDHEFLYVNTRTGFVARSYVTRT